jgi:hypothetical protein
MTKGQQAMAHAMIFPEADTAYPGKKSREGKLLETKSFSGARLSQARTVLAAAPDLARGVLNGSEPLDKAYETVRHREARPATATFQMSRRTGNFRQAGISGTAHM